MSRPTVAERRAHREALANAGGGPAWCLQQGLYSLLGRCCGVEVRPLGCGEHFRIDPPVRRYAACSKTWRATCRPVRRADPGLCCPKGFELATPFIFEMPAD